MFESKLLETIQVLEKDELAEFKDSPFFQDQRVKPEVRALFEYLLADYPKFDSAKLAKENVHQKIFPNKPYSENRLNQLMTALNRLLERFLDDHMHQQRDPATHHFSLARFFLERNLPHRFEAAIAHIEDLLDESPVPDENQLWARYQLAYLKHLHAGLNNPKKYDLNLTPVLNTLDTFYITQRLIITSALLFRTHQMKIDTSQTMVIYDYLDQWSKVTTEGPGQPLLQAYWRLLPLITETADMNVLIDYRLFIQKHRHELPAVHLKILYTIFRNYLVTRYHGGENAALEIIFSNLQEEYEQGFLWEPNGMIRSSTFQNVVTTALKLNKLSWVREFMDSCAHRITGVNEPEHIRIFNEANYYFHCGDFEKALDTEFHHKKYENYIYVLAARRLEIKIWYEKGDFSMSEYRTNALKSYLFANKDAFPDQIRKNNDDFVDVIRQLMSPRNRESAKRLSTLKDKFSAEKMNIAEREWFIDKFQELMT